jgi:thiamine biosynthesis lipoprotein
MISSTGHLHVEHVMGMAVTFDLRTPNVGGDTLGEAIAWLHHVDHVFSTWDPDSEISGLGRGELTLAELSDEVTDVLTSCEAIRRETDGAFDVFEVPAPNGTRLDPSGFVKGWAVERAAEMLESREVRDFTINAGGDIAVRGSASAGEAWRIGVRHPTVAGALALVVEATGPVGVATSATYERGAHIVDPRFGGTAIGLASATVVGPDLGLADAYATTLFVMGREGLDWLEGQTGYDGYVITHDDMTFWTAGFNQYLASDG